MRYTLLLAFIFVLGQLFGQGTLRGNIYDRETGEPIIFCNVTLEGTTLGTTTDLDGFFTFAQLDVGTYTLKATYIGYDSLEMTFTISDGTLRYEKLFMNPASIQLESVDITGRRSAQRQEVYISKISVTPQEIRSLPSTGGEADVAQYLQVIPGVISTGDQGGQIYIRGGSPVQNKILLDGMTIFNPFHSIGFFSVFETEALKSVDVLTGGFGAEQGGRISAVVDIKTREGNQSRYGGLVSLSPFQAKALIEGPIAKFSPDKDGSASFLFTAKTSLLDQTSETLYDYASDSLGLPYDFTDFYGKISLLGGNGSRLNLFGFNFDDNVNYTGIAELGWKNFGAGMNFRLVPPNSKLLIDGVISYSNYKISLSEADEAPRESAINAFNASLNFKYFGDNSELNYGFDIGGARTELSFRNFLGITIEDINNTTEIAGYISYRLQAGKLIIEPGLRGQFYASLGNFSLEPRFAFKLNASEKVRFKLSGGLYSQNLISTVNERDVVNLFVGFLSGPEERIYQPGTRSETDHKLQKAIHGIAGVEIDIARNVQVNIEPYFKRFTQLISLNRNKLSPQDPNYQTETGDAKGIDISARYETAQSLIWFTYSLGNVKRDDGDQEYRTHFDRRHNINLLASYRFGNKLLWEIGARWNFGSGFPFTLTQGFYGQYDFIRGLDTDYITGNPDVGILYTDERNTGQLPTYHRLDMSIKRKFILGKYTSIEANLSVTNVYDRENIFYFDRVRYERVDQLPILPSLGLTFTF